MFMIGYSVSAVGAVRKLTPIYYILTFAPIVILILVIGGLVMIVKKNEKTQKIPEKTLLGLTLKILVLPMKNQQLF